MIALALAGCKPATKLELTVLRSPYMADDPFIAPGTVQLRVEPQLPSPLTADTDVTLMPNPQIVSAPFRADAVVPFDVPNNVGAAAALGLAFFRQGTPSPPYSLGRSLQYGKGAKGTTVFVGVINAFSAAPAQPTIARWGATATPLADGTVLVAGGATGGSDQAPQATDALELYDPATGQFTPIDSTGFGARVYHTAVTDADGNVVFMGGLDDNAQPRQDVVSFDPATHALTALAPLAEPRFGHVAALITQPSDSGAILVAGGTVGGAASATGWIYRAGATAQPVAMPSPHTFAVLTPLPTNTGELLITGGLDATGAPTALATVYHPADETFVTPMAPNGTNLYRSQMSDARVGHIAVAAGLNDVIIIYGGFNGTTAIAKPEVFVPAAGVAGAFLDASTTGALNLPPTENAEALEAGLRNVVVVGGETSGTPLSTVLELQAIDPASTGGAQPFLLNATQLSASAPARARAALARLVDGTLLLVGGGVASSATQPRAPIDPTTAIDAQLFVPCFSSPSNESCLSEVTLSP